ncbi:MAG TPA: M1 family aminopeptidase [Pyrinomonadaceae bacterium]|nr:M1 family aminopeptidase [Pyrinomonadaceae bacterium]
MSTRRILVTSTLVCLVVVSVTELAFAQRRPSKSPLPQPAPSKIQKPESKSRYKIQLKIDFDALSYSGVEQVRWTNDSERPATALYFHLYSNLRPEQPEAVTNPSALTAEAEEPRIQITEVRALDTGAPLSYSLDDRGTILRVTPLEPIVSGASIEVVIGFKGNVPEVDAEETGLTTHVVKQVSAALRGEREIRRPRDLNFRCRGVMMLGTAYPVLAVNNGGEWARKLEPSVGDVVFNQIADYEVKIEVAPGVSVFTSAGATQEPEQLNVFAATALRDFAIVAGRTLRSEQTQVGEITLRSIFLPEHERVGKRVLVMAEEALKLFQARFGNLPFKTINITEAPLVAGLGSTEFSGLDVIASAYYVDFDSPAMRNLPEIIREQRPSVEESLEWSVAHLIAHQWWGAAVGNDPAREAVLDEAMSSWSALLYFRERHGEQKAAAIQQDQLQGVYRLYRTFGGEDMNANRPSRDYKNSFQYAAVVTTKGALMLVHLERLMGAEKLMAALRNYYQENLLKIATVDDLRGELIAVASIEQRRAVTRAFNRWLDSRHGDQDIAKPDAELATSLGLPSKPNQERGDGNALGALGRVGKFFWQQMTRIR